jgi:hypothetical protein
MMFTKKPIDLHGWQIGISPVCWQTPSKAPSRYIPKAQQWFRRALPLAIRLDRQVNSTDLQTKIRDLQKQCTELRSM